MLLTRSIATKTVQEIGPLVNKDINIMDINGIIIASTNYSRVGQSHWGAVKIIKESLPRLYITQDDIKNIETIDYVQSGLNLPLTVNGDTIGVIGITGEHNDVNQIGQIVKKMAEILLEDQVNNLKIARDKKTFELFILDFINFRSLNFGQGFINRAKLLKFDLFSNYVIISFKEQDDFDINKSEIRSFITSYAHNHINYTIKKSFLIERSDEWIVLIPYEQNIKVKIDYLCDSLSSKLNRETGIKLRFGISSIGSQDKPPYTIWEQSTQSLKYASMENQDKAFYDDLGLANLFFQLSESYKIEFLDKFFKNIPKDEIEGYLTLFEKYLKHEGSLNKISEEMFIHTNTVQYRLNKFAKINNKDIRKPSEAPLFYIAIYLAKEMTYNNDTFKLGISQEKK